MAKKTSEKTDAAGAATAEAPEREGEDRRDSYRVRIEAFEGPMDLLLYLIKKDEIDIYDIPIALITNQYLQYLEMMEQLDITVAGDFLVMASTLIYIKSKMLLPPEPKIEGEEDLNEDPRAELVERLLEYQRYKSASQMLHSRLEIESAVYTRGALETDKSNPEVSATVFDLLRVFNEILKRAESKIEMEIARDEVTMAEKLAEIYALLELRDEINVRELFEMARSKREMILTFLAVLELVKDWKIHIMQRELFSEIFARRRTSPPAYLNPAYLNEDLVDAPAPLAEAETGPADHQEGTEETL
ncbi:MAG: segregation and condensation protein A [Blastocatellia bacterium]